MTFVHTPEVITAVPVPFADNGGVAWDVLRALLSRIEPHVDSAFMSGTTAEFPSLTPDERSQALGTAVEVFGPGRVISHIGAASLHQVLPLAENAMNQGVTRMALLTPYYLPCGFDQIYDHYAAVCERFPGAEIYAYIFPERSGLTVSPAELARLTEIDGVAGAKLSGSPNAEFEAYVDQARPGSKVYSGDDSSFPRVMRAGGAGVVSGVSAAFPERFHRLRDALAQGDDAAVEQAQQACVEAVAATGPTITRLKYALAKRYGETWASRMALPPVPDDVAAEIDRLIAQS